MWKIVFITNHIHTYRNEKIWHAKNDIEKYKCFPLGERTDVRKHGKIFYLIYKISRPHSSSGWIFECECVATSMPGNILYLRVHWGAWISGSVEWLKTYQNGVNVFKNFNIFKNIYFFFGISNFHLSSKQTKNEINK